MYINQNNQLSINFPAGGSSISLSSLMCISRRPDFYFGDEIMNCLELEKKVFELANKAEWPIDRMDVGITTSIAMNDTQRNDLAAMMDFLEARNSTPSSILANVMHDLNGLKAVYLKDSSGKCFLPRSDGYAKKAS